MFSEKHRGFAFIEFELAEVCTGYSAEDVAKLTQVGVFWYLLIINQCWADKLRGFVLVCPEKKKKIKLRDFKQWKYRDICWLVKMMAP